MPRIKTHIQTRGIDTNTRFPALEKCCLCTFIACRPRPVIVKVFTPTPTNTHTRVVSMETYENPSVYSELASVDMSTFRVLGRVPF